MPAAVYPVPSQATGHLVTAADWNAHVDAFNDLNPRTTAVETTVNATGTTAAGNAALSSRLGTGVTTASTATAQLATLTTNVSSNTTSISTINTNLGTWSGGTAISRIGALETTVNATGTTAAGNAALSTRIGSGITTAAPADTRLAAVETTVNATGTTAAGNTALSTRIGTGITTAAPADTRLAAVETRTTDTSGTVGIGNQRLSDRLGATITNASTAAAQIGTLTTNVATINTNLGTWSGGTAISRIVALESAPSSSLGYKAGANYTTDITGIGTTESIKDNVSATLVSGRRYKITWSGFYYADGGTGTQNINLVIRYQSGATLTTSGTQVTFSKPNCVGSFVSTVSCIVCQFVAPSAGTFTMGLGVNSDTAGTVALGHNRQLIVEDIGT